MRVNVRLLPVVTSLAAAKTREGSAPPFCCSGMQIVVHRPALPLGSEGMRSLTSSSVVGKQKCASGNPVLWQLTCGARHRSCSGCSTPPIHCKAAGNAQLRRLTQLHAAAAVDAPMTAEGGTCAFERLLRLPGVQGQVALGEGQFGRGLMLTSSTDSGTSAQPGVAVSIPLHLALVIVKTKEYGTRGHLEWHERYLQTWQKELGATLPEKLLKVLRSENENDLLRLTAWLAWAVKHTAFWADYAQQLLPARAQPQSMIWAPDALYAATQDPAMRDPRSAQQVAAIRGKVVDLLHSCGDTGITTADVDWAMDMVTSRSISIPMSSTYVCLAPLADMANHNRATQWHFHMDINGGAFQIRFCCHHCCGIPCSNAPALPVRRHSGGGGLVPAGSEVFVSYSSKMSNAELLYAFAFALPGNPNDRLNIDKWQLQEGQARITPELVVSAKKGLQQQLAAEDVVGRCRLDAAANSLLRVTTPGWTYFPDNQLPEVDPRFPGTAIAAQGSGPQAQIDACNELATLVQQPLSSAVTTLQQDQDELAALLEGPNAHTLQRHCIQYRAEWKHVTLAAIAILEEIITMCKHDL